MLIWQILEHYPTKSPLIRGLPALKNMKDGYTIIFKGYTAVKDLSQGNFNLHKTFLDGLMEVSPAVKKYKRIADIFKYQLRITKEYKAAYNQFRDDKQLLRRRLNM